MRSFCALALLACSSWAMRFFLSFSCTRTFLACFWLWTSKFTTLPAPRTQSSLLTRVASCGAMRASVCVCVCVRWSVCQWHTRHDVVALQELVLHVSVIHAEDGPIVLVSLVVCQVRCYNDRSSCRDEEGVGGRELAHPSSLALASTFSSSVVSHLSMASPMESALPTVDWFLTMACRALAANMMIRYAAEMEKMLRKRLPTTFVRTGVDA